jgi:hypothetical protein
MCLSKSPTIQAPAAVTPPPAAQEAKDANINAVRRTRQQGQGNVSGGSLLTGGMQGGAGANTGAATLLGQ